MHVRQLLVLVLAVLAAAASLALPAAAQAPVFLAQWGAPGAGPGQFAHPRGLAIGANGHLYACDRDNHRIQEFELDGRFVRQWGTLGPLDGQFVTPVQVAIAPAGDVVVLDEGTRQVQAFTSTGMFEHLWGQIGPMSTWLYGPKGLVVTSDSHVIVSDPLLGYMMEYQLDGRLLSQWIPTWDHFPYYVPYMLAEDADGTIVAADYPNSVVRRITRDGAIVFDFLIVPVIENHAPPTVTPGIALDALGNIYLTDWTHDRVVEFSRDGIPLTTWGTRGSGPGQFNHPTGIAVDARGFVYVADTDNQRIQVFGPLATPTHATSWGALKVSRR